jgi:hypothetical protein
MSTIETDAKPILTSLIHGEHIILKIEDRRNLSVWISLKILVSENNVHYGYDADPIFDFGTRDRFKHTRSVPDGFKIWIAPHKGAKWRLGYHRHAAGLWAAPTAPKYRGTPKNIQSITWGVGKLLIHVLATTNAKVYGMLDLMGPTAPNQLWPLTTNDIVWPGNFSLTDEDADVLARVLDTLFASPGVLWAPPSD